MNLDRLGGPLLAAAAGGAAVFGFPPAGFGVLTPAAIAVLALMLPSRTPRRAAGLAFIFAIVMHFGGLTWISEAFLVKMPVLGLAAFLALYFALAAYLWRRFWPGSDSASAPAFLALAALLSLGEWTMGHALTGFPWTTVSLAVAETRLANAAAVTGAYGVGLVVLAATLALAGALKRTHATGRFGMADAAAASVAATMLAAAWALPPTPGPTPAPDAAWPVIRMVQANTPQREKWRPGNQALIFARHMSLSIEPAERPLAAIVWPETATPFPVTESPSAMQALAEAAPEGGYMILGAPLRDPKAGGGFSYANSMIAVAAGGGVAARYDKAHLVPGGEYVPLADILPIGGLVPGAGSFKPGTGLRTLRLEGLPAFSPLICYEVIFPNDVARDDDRPEFLLNITNDAWYGRSAGPFQHLAIARLRAIEEGLPLIRVANTGISAAFDGRGRDLGRIELDTRGFLDVALPPPEAPTVYARQGDLIYFGMVVLFLVAAFAAEVLSRRSARSEPRSPRD